MKQLELLAKPATEHGGSLNRGRRKTMRPVDRKKPMHLVLRSTRARGDWNFLRPRHKGLIYLLVEKTANEYGVKIYGYENVGNHLHLLVKARTRPGFQNFLRVVTRRVVSQVTGARKGYSIGRFWDGLVYSRVLQWGRAFRVAKKYLQKNQLEALGFRRTEINSWVSIERLEAG